MARRYDISEDQLSLFTGFEVQITIFEGPLDLLLHLVRREQVNIAEISMAQITGQYLDYMAALEELNVELAAEFLVVAAQLIYIKSRNLLPTYGDETEEEEMDLDPQVELARQLEEYRAYKEAAGILDEAHQLRQKIYLRSSGNGDVGSGFVDLGDVSVFDMVAAVGELLQRAVPEPPRLLHRRTVTVAQRMPEIITELHAAGAEGLRFTDLVEMPASRVFIIVTFLAILELIRRGRLKVGAIEGESNFRVRLAK